MEEILLERLNKKFKNNDIGFLIKSNNDTIVTIDGEETSIIYRRIQDKVFEYISKKVLENAMFNELYNLIIKELENERI